MSLVESETIGLRLDHDRRNNHIKSISNKSEAKSNKSNFQNNRKKSPKTQDITDKNPRNPSTENGRRKSRKSSDKMPSVFERLSAKPEAKHDKSQIENTLDNRVKSISSKQLDSVKKVKSNGEEPQAQKDKIALELNDTKSIKLPVSTVKSDSLSKQKLDDSYCSLQDESDICKINDQTASINNNASKDSLPITKLTFDNQLLHESVDIQTSLGLENTNMPPNLRKINSSSHLNQSSSQTHNDESTSNRNRNKIDSDNSKNRNSNKGKSKSLKKSPKRNSTKNSNSSKPVDQIDQGLTPKKVVIRKSLQIDSKSSENEDGNCPSHKNENNDSEKDLSCSNLLNNELVSNEDPLVPNKVKESSKFKEIITSQEKISTILSDINRIKASMKLGPDIDKDICDPDNSEDIDNEFYKVELQTRLVSYTNSTLTIKNISKVNQEEEEEQKSIETDESSISSDLLDSMVSQGSLQSSSSDTECSDEVLKRQEASSGFFRRESVKGRLSQIVTKGKSLLTDVYNSGYLPDVKKMQNKLLNLRTREGEESESYLYPINYHPKSYSNQRYHSSKDTDNCDTASVCTDSDSGFYSIMSSSDISSTYDATSYQKSFMESCPSMTSSMMSSVSSTITPFVNDSIKMLKEEEDCALLYCNPLQEVVAYPVTVVSKCETNPSDFNVDKTNDEPIAESSQQEPNDLPKSDFNPDDLVKMFSPCNCSFVSCDTGNDVTSDGDNSSTNVSVSDISKDKHDTELLSSDTKNTNCPKCQNDPEEITFSAPKEIKELLHPDHAR